MQSTTKTKIESYPVPTQLAISHFPSLINYFSLLLDQRTCPLPVWPVRNTKQNFKNLTNDSNEPFSPFSFYLLEYLENMTVLSMHANLTSCA